ncbi:hypothetical protein [uncultured Microbulbifer sp.]|uniref:baseplate complex protein n=1 Tax=uncultured Microbulbifer sp. TaxID=348147 RepID=UPI0026355EC2|nr:hypothetical protein [uncultured Microbulbifer sp.]
MLLNDISIPKTELQVSVTTELNNESLGGETSSTSSAHKGIKPKLVSVSFVVKYTDHDDLTQFYRLAEATDNNGDLLIYDITDRSVNAANIRQVIFNGRIEQRELIDRKAWRVSFALQEYLSVAEKIEQRISSEENTTSTPLQDSTNQTGFERVLQMVDTALVPR